jgi:hypothetical protein
VAVAVAGGVGVPLASWFLGQRMPAVVVPTAPLWWSLPLNGGKGKKITDTAQRNNRSGGGNEKLKLIWLFIL